MVVVIVYLYKPGIVPRKTKVYIPMSFGKDR